jgi:starch-binding outer membrane protein, SusD/RagB family
MKKLFQIINIILLTSFFMLSCSTDFLDEEPKDFLSPENAFLNQAGFEAGIAAIHSFIRIDELDYREDMWYGTDAMRTGEPGIHKFEDYSIVTSVHGRISKCWNNAYLRIIPNVNELISKAENPEVKWNTATSKQEIIAEARFFRGYSYNILACLYGGVPIVTEPSASPSVSYTRATKQETLEQARKDFEFAAQNLPETPSQKGRISKAAAYHFLAEVCTHLGMYKEAIDAASAVINNSKYKLMTQRFGVKKDKPGDVYSDLHTEGNENLDINTEAIWVVQVEYNVTGGGANNSQFAWNPRYWNANIPGTTRKGFIVVDTLARPAGYLRGTNLFNYFIWSDQNDIRNSEYNIKRTFWYNNPANPEFFGKKITLKEYYKSNVSAQDTIMNLYPFLWKVYATPFAGMGARANFKDIYRVRLAETYLIRAEAYLKNNQAALAAADINTVRVRAAAAPIAAGEVTLDFILDERLRELYVEEYRRCTLQRMGKLVERVRKYNAQAGSTIADYHELWPIPQTVIDRNFGAELEQNPGY